MSLSIEVESVRSVLLADGWHDIVRKSFELDAYEFHADVVPILAGGAIAGVPSLGAKWTDATDGQVIACPITSVLAVKISSPPY
jgi:hypothetical protein